MEKGIVFCPQSYKLKRKKIDYNNQILHSHLIFLPFFGDLMHYGRFLEMIEGVYEENLKIALDLKRQGKKIYVLSNFPGDQFDKYMKQNRYLEEFDDMIISGKVGLKKPDIKIYQLALKKFDCIPSQTLFIDDRPENTDSAKELGLNVITLDNPNKLKEYIKKFI